MARGRRPRKPTQPPEISKPESTPVPYRIVIIPAAVRQLAKLPAEARRQVGRKIDTLAANPRPRGVEKLSGEDDLYRVRTGNYRILYQIQDAILTITVVKTGDRKDVYRQL